MMIKKIRKISFVFCCIILSHHALGAPASKENPQITAAQIQSEATRYAADKQSASAAIQAEAIRYGAYKQSVASSTAAIKNLYGGIFVLFAAAIAAGVAYRNKNVEVEEGRRNKTIEDDRKYVAFLNAIRSKMHMRRVHFSSLRADIATSAKHLENTTSSDVDNWTFQPIFDQSDFASEFIGMMPAKLIDDINLFSEQIEMGSLIIEIITSQLKERRAKNESMTELPAASFGHQHRIQRIKGEIELINFSLTTKMQEVVELCKTAMDICERIINEVTVESERLKSSSPAFIELHNKR